MKKTMAIVGVVLGLMAGGANAALFSRAGGTMVYDSVLNITWLADMNVNGLMGWDAATVWADNLVYGGYSDWRLPTLNPSDTTCTSRIGGGYNCTGGELSHLFVTDLGNQAAQSVLIQTGDTPTQIANLLLFSKVQSYGYWSGTEDSNDRFALLFNTGGGDQGFENKGVAFYAVAVRDGDVPIPGTVALLGLGLVGIGAARRKQA